MALPTPSQLKPPFDIDVVGRGIVGLGVAYKLAKAGLKVRVIGESDPKSASRIATGIVSIKGENRQTDSPLFSLKIDGHKSLRNFISEFSQDFSRFSTPPVPKKDADIFHFGIFEPLRDQLDFHVTHKRVHHGEDIGKYGTKFLTELPAYLDSFSPKNSSAFFGGFFYPQDIYFNCGYLLDNMEMVLKALGVFFLEVQVTSLESNSYGLYFRSHDQEIHRLSTHTVLCTGAGTPELLESSSFFEQNLGDHLSLNLGQKLNAYDKFGEKNEEPFAHGDHHVCIKKNSYGFLRTEDPSRGYTQLEFQSPKNWQCWDQPSALIEAYERECQFSFRNLTAQDSSLSFEWMKAQRVRTKDRMPWIATIHENTSESSDRSFVHVATAMYKSGYQLFWVVAEQVFEKIKPLL